MRNRTLVVVLAVILCVALASVAFAAGTTAPKASKSTKAVSKAPAKAVNKLAAPKAAGKFDQQAMLNKLWNAPDNTVVGVVDGAKVTKGDLLKTMWFWNAPTVLQDILNQKMIEQAGKKSGVKLSQADIQSQISQSLQRMNMANVDDLLAQFKITKERFNSGIKISAMAEKIVQKSVKVTDADYSQFVRARHILIQFPKDEQDKAKQEEIAKKKIDEVAQKIKNGEDFAKLADEYTEDPGNVRDGAKQGGDLGWFTRGRMVQEFEKAAFELKAGQVSEPVKTFYGYHIIKVEKIGKDASTDEKLQLNAQILERKIPGEMGKWYQELQQNTKVDNKLMAPVEKPVAPAYAPQAPRPMPAPKPQAPAVSKPPVPKAVEPQPSEKPETPPPPPAPAN